jgi:hypothetical protein
MAREPLPTAYDAGQPSPVSATIAALMGTQRGLVLRRQARHAGLTDEQVDRLVATGAWVTVRRGVYTTSAHWEILDERRGRRLLRAWAASLNMSMPHVLSHESAALAHDMPILWPSRWHTHVTRFGVTGCRTRHGVCHHLAPFEPHQIVDVEGVPTFDMARTAVDIRQEPWPEAGAQVRVVACDSAMRAGVTRAELEAALAPMKSWPNVTIARTSVAMADPGSDSVGESLGRLLVAGFGVGEVQTQFGLREGRRTAWVDLRVGRHLVEFDGKVKYQRTEDGGLAEGDPGRVLWEEKQRQDWLCGFKLGMSRLVWDDVMPPAWAATERRVMREVMDTRARFGDDLSDLQPFIIREPRRRRG